MLMRRLGRFFGCVESCKACENELLTITGDEELDPSAVSRSHVTKSWILYGAYISSFYLGRWDGLRWRDSDERQISVRLFLQVLSFGGDAISLALNTWSSASP